MIHSYLIDDATIQVDNTDTLGRGLAPTETAVKCYVVWATKNVTVQAGENLLAIATVLLAPDTVISAGNKIKIGSVSYHVVSVRRKRAFPDAELLEAAIT